MFNLLTPAQSAWVLALPAHQRVTRTCGVASAAWCSSAASIAESLRGVVLVGPPRYVRYIRRIVLIRRPVESARLKDWLDHFDQSTVSTYLCQLDHPDLRILHGLEIHLDLNLGLDLDPGLDLNLDLDLDLDPDLDLDLGLDLDLDLNLDLDLDLNLDLDLDLDLRFHLDSAAPHWYHIYGHQYEAGVQDCCQDHVDICQAIGGPLMDSGLKPRHYLGWGLQLWTLRERFHGSE